MTENIQHEQKEKVNKWRVREGSTPAYKAFQAIYITKDLPAGRDEKLIEFINKHIAEYKGTAESGHGIPLMLFERKQDAHTFANEISEKLNIPREHIAVKAQKYTR